MTKQITVDILKGMERIDKSGKWIAIANEIEKGEVKASAYSNLIKETLENWKDKDVSALTVMSYFL